LQVFFTPTIINFAIFIVIMFCDLLHVLCKKQVKTGILISNFSFLSALKVLKRAAPFRMFNFEFIFNSINQSINQSIMETGW